MPTIRKFHDEITFEIIECDCIGTYIKENIDDFKTGYRLYIGQDDVTESPERLAAGDKFTMMRPSLGPISLVTSIIIAAVTAVAIVALTPRVKAPSTSARDQTSSTNSLAQRLNESAPNSRVDDIYGRVTRHVPRLIQVPHIRYIDNVKHEHFAGYIGEGDYELTQDGVRDGDTPFARLQNSKFNAWNSGGNPNTGTPADFTIGGEINRPLVNVQKSSELTPTELLPPNDLSAGDVTYLLTGNGATGTVTVDTAPSGFDLTDFYEAGQQVNFLEVWHLSQNPDVTLYRSNAPNPPIQKNFENYSRTNVSGLYTINSVTPTSMEVTIPFSPGSPERLAWDAMVNYSPYTFAYFFTDFTTLLGLRTFDADIVAFTWYSDLALTMLISTGEDNLSPTIDIPFDGTIGPFQSPQNVDTCVLNFSSFNGFYKIVQGNDTTVTIDLRVTIEETDSSGNPLGPTNSFDVEYTTNEPNKTKPVGLTVDIPSSEYPGAQLYEYFRISVRRLTDRDKSDNVSNADRCEWVDLDFYFDIGANPDYGDTSVFQVEIEQNPSTLQVKERLINLDVTRLITPYIGNGNFGPLQPVETVAEVTIALALDKRNGRLTLDEIDADLLLDVQDQLIQYYGNSDYVKVGYDLDSTSLRFQDSFSLFWDAVNCRAYSQGAVYRVYPSIKRDDSSKQFTHRNKVLGTDSRDWINSTENDGVELTYRSNATGKFETIILHINGVSSVNRLKVELSGATQESTAVIRAYRELNIIKYRRFNYQFDADGIGRLTVPGERVDNVDNTRIVKRENNSNVYNIYDGQVVAINGLEVQLSQPVVFESGENHTIRFTSSTGDLLEAIQCTQGQTAYHVVLSQSPSQPIYTGYKREKTTFTFAADSARLSLPMIVLGTKPKTTRGLKVRTLTGINDDDRYYQNDQDFSGA